jgi:ribosomal-protein-alanine N-acetyltransferase
MTQSVEQVQPEPALDIVPMAPAHLDEVLGIERESFSNPWRKGDFEHALRRSSGYAIVAHQTALIVGYAIGFFVRAEFHLASLAVRRGLRRRGVGRALLVRVFEAAGERGAKVMTLEVRMSNAPAISLYEKAGFRRIAIREDYYTHPSEDAFVLMKTLREDPWGP